MELTCGILGYRKKDCVWNKNCKEYKEYLKYVDEMLREIVGYYNHFIIGTGGGVQKEVENVLKKLYPLVTYEVVSENYIDTLINKCEYALVFCSNNLGGYVRRGIKKLDKVDMDFDKYLLKCVKPKTDKRHKRQMEKFKKTLTEKDIEFLRSVGVDL